MSRRDSILDAAACFLAAAAVSLIMIVVCLTVSGLHIPTATTSARAVARGPLTLDDPAQCWRLLRYHIDCDGTGTGVYARPQP